MADTFTLQIDGDLADRLRRRAAEAGAPLESFTRLTLEQGLFRYEDFTWIGDDPRTTPHTSEDEEGAEPLDQVEAELLRHLDERVAVSS